VEFDDDSPWCMHSPRRFLHHAGRLRASAVASRNDRCERQRCDAQMFPLCVLLVFLVLAVEESLAEV